MLVYIPTIHFRPKFLTAVNCGKCELSQTGLSDGHSVRIPHGTGYSLYHIDDHQEDASHFIVDMILPFLRSTTTAQQPQKMIQR